MLRALRTIVSIDAMRIVQSSVPREFLRAQSRSIVVRTLGTMKTAAGIRSTLPMSLSVAQGDGEVIFGPEMSEDYRRATRR